jgi:hypothetical protein
MERLQVSHRRAQRTASYDDMITENHGQLCGKSPPRIRVFSNKEISSSRKLRWCLVISGFLPDSDVQSSLEK